MGLAVQGKSVCQNIYQKKFSNTQKVWGSWKTWMACQWMIIGARQWRFGWKGGLTSWTGVLVVRLQWKLDNRLAIRRDSHKRRNLTENFLGDDNADAQTNLTDKFWLLPTPNSSDGFVALWVLLAGGFISIMLVDMQHLREVQHPQPVAPEKLHNQAFLSLTTLVNAQWLISHICPDTMWEPKQGREEHWEKILFH